MHPGIIGDQNLITHLFTYFPLLEFDADVLVQNGIFYEAKLPVKHCPNVAGCRSTVKQANGNNIFQLLENFIFSVKVT